MIGVIIKNFFYDDGLHELLFKFSLNISAGFHWCSDSLEDKIKIMVVNLSRTGLIAGPRFQGYDNSCSPLRAVSSTGYQKQLQARMIFCLHELIFSLTFLWFSFLSAVLVWWYRGIGLETPFIACILGIKRNEIYNQPFFLLKIMFYQIKINSVLTTTWLLAILFYFLRAL